MNVANHFDQRSKTYNNQSTWVDNKVIEEAFFTILDLEQSSRFIDIGAGTGVILKSLLPNIQSEKTLVAFDLSQGMLKQIVNQEIYKVLGDAHQFPFPNDCFNVAVARQSLHYMENLSLVLTGVGRILKSQGIFLIAQIMPYGTKDYDYWKKITTIRQPLRNNLLHYDFLTQELQRSHFHIERTLRIQVPESLNSWLSRYPTTQEVKTQITRLFIEAPEFYKDIYSIEQTNHDVTFKNCWYIIKSVAS